MAIVKTCHFGSRTVHFADDYYRDVPKEEIQRRIRNMQEVVGDILYRQQLRELEEKKKDTAG